MGSLFKIISVPEEKPVVKRSVPPVDLSNIDALADFYLIFGDFPSLDNHQAQSNLHQLQSEHNFGSSSTVSQLDALFAKIAFLKSFEKQSETRKSLVYFCQQLIAAGKIPTAKRVLDRLIEYTRDPDEALSLRFLKISFENKLEPLVREFYRLAQERPQLTIWPLSIHSIARFLISTKQFNLIEPLLNKMNLPGIPAGIHAFPEAICEVVRGDAHVAQEKNHLAIPRYENAQKIIEKALKQNQDAEKVRLLYQNLQLAVELKLLAAYRSTNKFELARTMLDLITQRTDNLPLLYLDLKSKEALWLTLGEHYLARGDKKTASQYFQKSDSLHALTRLNELAFNKLETAPKLGSVKAQRALAAMDKEARFRETGEELALLALQKFSLARRIKMLKTCAQALDALVEATENTPLLPLVLAYYASQPFCQAGTKRRFIRTRIPKEITPETEIQKEIALTLFGTTEPKMLAEAARSIKRRLAEATPATQLPVATIAEAEIAEMLVPYNEKAAQMRAQLTEFLAGVKQGDNLIFSGDVINGFKLLDQAGISSFRIIADRKEKTARVRITNNLGESFEQEINEDFDLTKINSHPFYHLLTLVVIDFFLVLQLEDAYKPVFAQLDYKFFAESEFLQLDRLQEQLHLLFDRVPSESERTIDSLERQVAAAETETMTTPDLAASEGENTIPLDDKKEVFTYGPAREGLREGVRLKINIPKEASLIPLAKLLDALEVKVNGAEINLTLYAGAQQINLTIDPEGNIAISDYSRGITNFELIRQLNEIVLDLLNAHFSPEYRETLKVADPRRKKVAFRALFEAVQNSKIARDRKWAIYNLNPPTQRPFEVAKVAGQIEHPFETTFFEETPEETGKRELIPIPEMKAEKAITEIKAGKKIIQVGIVRIHRKNSRSPISADRINEYILKHILQINLMPEEASPEEMKQVERIKNRILAGEATADPNGFLRPDPEDSSRLTMDTVLVKDGTVLKRIHHTFVKPHLSTYTMMVTEFGTLRATSGRRPSKTRPRPKTPKQPAPKPEPEQKQIPAPNFAKPETKRTPAKIYNPRIRREASLTLTGREMLRELRSQGLHFHILSAATGLSTSRIILVIRGEERVSETELADIRRLYDSKRKNS